MFTVIYPDVVFSCKRQTVNKLMTPQEKVYNLMLPAENYSFLCDLNASLDSLPLVKEPSVIGV